MRIRTFIDWLLMRSWEAKYARRFDCCIMMSHLDADRVLRNNPHLVTAVVPNGVDVGAKRILTPAKNSSDILLIGNLNHPPWADAVRFFHDRIFPLIYQQVANARMVVVGDAPPLVEAMASENVLISGWVEAVQPCYQQAAVSVVPLRAGGGTRLKILESLAYGRPVVSTSVGCEGLDLVAGRHLLVADEPAEFAHQAVRLLTDPELRQSLRSHGRRRVELRYSWDNITDRLLATYEEVCQQ